MIRETETAYKAKFPGELAQHNKAQWFRRYGKCCCCVAKVHVLIRGGLSRIPLETMGLPDELLAAIEFARKIRSRGARRRQIQYVGALMRHIDPQPIENALDRIRTENLRK